MMRGYEIVEVVAGVAFLALAVFVIVRAMQPERIGAVGWALLAMLPFFILLVMIEIARPEEVGRASFYSKPQHVACGGKFDPRAMTAAHRTLPCGTKIQVTNPRNGKTVMVQITDRGPAKRTGRALDVSRAAAKALGFERAGVTKLAWKVLPKSPKEPATAGLGTIRPAPGWIHERRFRGCTRSDPCMED